jgi:hypothetical protein
MYKNHVEQRGPPASSETAQELIAGFAAATIDRVIEAKGLHKTDRKIIGKAKQKGEQVS